MGTQIYSFQGHTGNVSSVTFSADGSQVVSCSLDTIRVWDVTQCGGYSDHTLSILKFSSHTCLDYSLPNSSVCFSSTRKHALCNADKLFTGMESGSETQDTRDMIRSDHDGWIIGPAGQLLFWVPPSLHGKIYMPRNTLLIPRGGPELDLSHMVHGETWQQCYLGKE